MEPRKGAHTGDGEAKGVRVICEETLEYCRFTRTRRARYNDWTVDLCCYQVQNSATTTLAEDSKGKASYPRVPFWSDGADK